MGIILLYVFGGICVAGIAQTYVFYPAFLILFGKKSQKIFPTTTEFSVAIVIAAYNEENVLQKKIESLVNSHYPLEKISIYIGSDASSDRTNEIVQNFANQYGNIHLKVFEGRSGKAFIINDLVKDCCEDIIILTDANVFFRKDTISNLVKYFSNSDVKQVCANIVKTSEKNKEIQGLEKAYLWLENTIKSREGNTWGFVIGAEGGCYAIRREAYTPVPKNFFMDDFFITMSVIKNQGKVLFAEEAVCFEDLPAESAEEFKRKVRISIGNYQNLNAFKSLLWPIWSSVSFAFLSHKVLRWLTPFLLIFLFIISVVLGFTNEVFMYLAAAQALLFLSPFFISLLKNVKPLLFIAHFYNMNLALLIGFFKYLNGVKSSIWQPTQRTSA